MHGLSTINTNKVRVHKTIWVHRYCSEPNQWSASWHWGSSSQSQA